MAQHFNLNDAEIYSLARQGIEAIFADETEKARLRQIIRVPSTRDNRLP